MNYKKDSFNLAAAFTAYDNETEPILDPSYGELVFKHCYWGKLNEDGEYEAARERIKSQHTCTSDELGFGDDPNLSKF